MKTIKLITLFLCFFSLTMYAQKRKTIKIAIISASNQYASPITLKEYKNYLEDCYSNIAVTLLQAKGPVNEKGEFSELEETDKLKDCDILLVFARRTTIGGKALEDFKNFVASGKPIVALRTSSHGFQNWPEFDKTVLGGNYSGHYFDESERREIEPGQEKEKNSVRMQSVTINEVNKTHPILKGISNFESMYILYRTSPIAPDATLLLTGTVAEGNEPLAWTRKYNGANIVYIALGGIQDWKNPVFTTLVTNSLAWAGNVQFKHKK